MKHSCLKRLSRMLQSDLKNVLRSPRRKEVSVFMMRGVPLRVSIEPMLWIPVYRLKNFSCYRDDWPNCRLVSVPMPRFMLCCRNASSRYLKMLVLIGVMPRPLHMPRYWMRVCRCVSRVRIHGVVHSVTVIVFCMI